MLLAHIDFSSTRPSFHLHLLRNNLHGLFRVHSYELCSQGTKSENSKLNIFKDTYLKYHSLPFKGRIQYCL